MIRIDVLGTIWEPAKKLKLRSFRAFELWLALKFVQRVQLAVKYQKYSSAWPPLSRRWLKEKLKRGLSLKTWEASKELISSLTVKSKSKHPIIGFDARRRHRMATKPLLPMAVALEFGSPLDGVPPRPLFRKVYWEMANNLSKLYQEYQQTGGAL